MLNVKDTVSVDCTDSADLENVAMEMNEWTYTFLPGQVV